MKRYEIEEKYRLANPRAMRKTLKALKAKLIRSGKEQNLFYDRCGVFAKSGFALRLRKVGPDAWLTLKGRRLQSKPVKRIEIESPVQFNEFKVMLKYLSCEIKLQYTKHREVYTYGKTEVTLDHLPGLGWFMEIEGASRAITAVRQKLGLSKDDYEPKSYLAMVLAHKSKKPRKAPRK